MDRHQRRGAGGIDRHARPPQIEEVGDAIGRDAVRHAAAGVGVNPLRVALGPAGVVPGADPNEDPRPAAGEAFLGDPGILQRLPGHLQQEPLLRIHAGRLARGDAKEVRIKLVHLLQEAPPPGHHLPRGAGIGIIERFHIPPVRRDLGDRIHPVAEQLPVTGGIGRAGEPATQPHHSDGLIAPRGGKLLVRLLLLLLLRSA